MEAMLGDEAPFQVQPQHWQPILAALQPAQPDPDPYAWMVLGQLDVVLDDGSEVQIALYELSETPGAFSIKGSYFRGGDSQDLERALRAAYEASKAQNGASSRIDSIDGAGTPAGS